MVSDHYLPTMNISAQPVDHATRLRFTTETSINFSLTAPAGSGKTRAISDRIASIASEGDALVRLPRLVAVTYTNKAADEMRQRAGMAIRANNASSQTLQAFERSFFGTIHSFAAKLLRDYGHYIGVSPGFEVAPDIAALWKLFLLSRNDVVSDEVLVRLLRHLSYADMQVVAGSCQSLRPSCALPTQAPSLDCTAALAYVPLRKQSMATVARAQRSLKAFLEVWNGGGDGFAALPSITEGGAEFEEICSRALAPAREWLRLATAHFAHALSTQFREWRVAKGLLTYDDQISMAADLFRHGVASRAIREMGYSVILDEAQDTDPSQFSLLLEAVRPVDASGIWSEEGSTPPGTGRFTMVGDIAQSIYTARADLETCMRVQTYITQPGVGEALTFTTTFRCDRAVLGLVNKVGPVMLNGKGEQVSYVPLQPRPDAGIGAVIRMEITVPNGAEATAPTSVQLLQEEGRQIGVWLRKKGLAGLGVSAWNQVALLVPRTAWIGAIRQGLLSEGVRSTVLSQSERNCDRPAYLWTTAMATVLAEQRNAWEIVGVLRDVYGISDRGLASFAQGQGERFYLDSPHKGGGEVTAALRELADLRNKTYGLPLRDAFEQVDCAVLRPRLRALPVERYGNIDADLDLLSSLAAKIESAGGDMVTFSRYLREHLSDRTDANGDDPSAVCLLTNHKSKGLEWPVVILPTFFRDFSFESPSYPRVIGSLRDPITVALTRDDATEHDCRERVRAQQEIERLLYVSLTRGKRVVAICDDRNLWSSKRSNGLSLAYAMRADSLPELLLDLPSELRIPDLGPVSDIRLSPTTVDIDLASVRNAAANVAEKITPHRLAQEHDREGMEARMDDRNRPLPISATLYGTWWHDTMRRMPWHRPSDYQSHFESELPACPDPDRARAEFGFLVDSPLAQELSTAESVRCECPFVVPVDGGVLEGVIDLVYQRGEEVGIVDWKTTQSMSPSGAIEAYGPQIRPYRDVISAMIKKPVSAKIYLTKTGDTVRVDSHSGSDLA